MMDTKGRTMKVKDIIEEMTEKIGQKDTVIWLAKDSKYGGYTEREHFGEILEVTANSVILETKDCDEISVPLRAIAHYWNELFKEI